MANAPVENSLIGRHILDVDGFLGFEFLILEASNQSFYSSRFEKDGIKSSSFSYNRSQLDLSTLTSRSDQERCSRKGTIKAREAIFLTVTVLFLKFFLLQKFGYLLLGRKILEAIQAKIGEKFV